MPDLDIFDEIDNPLDCIEDVFLNNDWVFSRPHADELNIQISGENSVYGLTFIWQDKYNAMQLYCEFDLSIPKKRGALINTLLRRINDRLWIGHFDVPDQSPIPCFRHTVLFRGPTLISGTDQVEDLVEIALAECERHYPVFALLCSNIVLDEATLELALADQAGRA